MNKDNLTRKSLEEMRLNYKLRSNNVKYPRQKLLPKYREIYSWVLADDSDPCFVFCSACECRLTAKRSDLAKHQNSIKHCENIIKMGAEPERKEEPPTATNNNEIHLNQNTPMCLDLVKELNNAHFINKTTNCTEKLAKPQNLLAKNKRKALATCSLNDTTDISDVNASKLMRSTPCTITSIPPVCNDHRPTVDAFAVEPESKVEPTARASTPQRDPCVLFFESVCASIKSMPPQLAAEGKVRIMQLIGELEVRALADCKQQNQIIS